MKIGVILAGGKSSRFRSEIPKGLHKIDGKSIIGRIIDSFKLAKIDKIYIIVNRDNYPYFEKEKWDVNYLFQDNINGTGGAFYCLNGMFNENDQIIVVNGDCFMFDKNVVKKFCDTCELSGYNLGLVVREEKYNYGYGRVCVNKGFIKIIEQSELKEVDEDINLINVGIYYFDGKFLCENMETLDNNHKENKITILFDKEEGFIYESETPIKCINDKKDFMDANKLFYLFRCNCLLNEGIKIYDSSTTYIGEDVVVGRNVEIYPNNYILGSSIIGDNSVIMPNSYIENSLIGNGCSIGPFANLKKGNIIGDNVIIGAYVEVKNSEIKDNVKAKHHAYLGDVYVGEKTNIGCGVIVANYDGKNKHKSHIGKNCFIGSNVTVISPVNIGENAVIGAGSTIVRDVCANSLAIAREKQINKDNYYSEKD